MITSIILAASFDLQIMPPADPGYRLGEDVAAAALYVCPAADSVWDSIASGLRPFVRYLNMGFFFALMLLLFGWGWALYQNLLEDKFKQDAFKNSWAFTKVIFWAAVVMLLLVWTPNNYRTVHVGGAPENYVLCEADTPGALPVRAAGVKR
jgi:hypothetical protein